MYGQNKTQNWLSLKPENEQNKIIVNVRSKRKNIMKDAKENRKQLYDERVQIINHKIKGKKENEDKRLKKRKQS